VGRGGSGPSDLNVADTQPYKINGLMAFADKFCSAAHSHNVIFYDVSLAVQSILSRPLFSQN